MRNDIIDRKADLKIRLIDAAEMEIAEKGLSELKARQVTARAGCALGGLYTAFADIDLLILHVNARTLARLGEALHAAIPAGADPVSVMHALAGAYLAFAEQNQRLWAAVFSHQLSESYEIPEWHMVNHSVLISEIIAPLSKLRPDLDPETRRVRAQSIFAAVHGVVQLSMNGRYVGAPRALLSREVHALVTAMTRGLTTGQTGEAAGEDGAPVRVIP